MFSFPGVVVVYMAALLLCGPRVTSLYSNIETNTDRCLQAPALRTDGWLAVELVIKAEREEPRCHNTLDSVSTHRRSTAWNRSTLPSSHLLSTPIHPPGSVTSENPISIDRWLKMVMKPTAGSETLFSPFQHSVGRISSGLFAEKFIDDKQSGVWCWCSWCYFLLRKWKKSQNMKAAAGGRETNKWLGHWSIEEALSLILFL